MATLTHGDTALTATVQRIADWNRVYDDNPGGLLRGETLRHRWLWRPIIGPAPQDPLCAELMRHTHGTQVTLTPWKACVTGDERSVSFDIAGTALGQFVVLFGRARHDTDARGVLSLRPSQRAADCAWPASGLAVIAGHLPDDVCCPRCSDLEECCICPPLPTERIAK